VLETVRFEYHKTNTAEDIAFLEELGHDSSTVGVVWVTFSVPEMPEGYAVDLSTVIESIKLHRQVEDLAQ